MDIVRLYKDFGVDHATEGHKHTRPGWVNTECPFCEGNPGLHLGWSLNEEFYVCWRCGWHPPVKTVAELLHISFEEASKLLLQYGINRTVIPTKEIIKRKFKFPSNTLALSSNHKAYLKGRGFDWREIEEKWQIKGTGPISTLGDFSYKFRIIIPFIWNGQVVSFDSRDITNKQPNKYQACPSEFETIGHKDILYGNQEMWNSKLGICVEGPTDVWRMGELSFATSGIKYKNTQVRIIANTFERVAVIFDDDIQAQVQAKKLVAELKFRGVDAFNVEIKGDPGSLSKEEAKQLIKSIK